MVRSGMGVNRAGVAVWVGKVFVSTETGLDVALKTEVLEEVVLGLEAFTGGA